MKESRDIEVLRLAAENQSLQAALSFYMEKAENSVSREEYEAKVAECEAIRKELDKTQEVLKQTEAFHKSELAVKDRELTEYREAQVLLKTENTDFKTLWEFWQRHHFGASSETMTDMMDRMVGRLPSGKTSMLADIMSFIDRSGHDGWTTPVQKNKDVCTGVGDRRGKDKGEKSRTPRGSRCMDVREIFGPDFSDLPSDVKVIMRKGKPDTTVIEMLFIERAMAYSKKYTIARCNVPGSDPMNTKYPPRLFERIPVDPSFARFYLEMKFGYNLSEGRIVEMPGKMGCMVDQATLNRWMHIVIDGLYKHLMPEMLAAIKGSGFTHNDETRILVRSKDPASGASSYNTEYIHGILSPEAKLFIMLYENGSRSHEVQLSVFEDSSITAFLADRCALYTALIRVLPDCPLIRGACWVHFRRYLLHAYLHDKRLERMIHLLARLFAAEKIISEIRNLTEQQRVRERQLMCRPIVEAIFKFMEGVRAAGTEYGVLARRAADYLLDDREGFCAFLTCGRMEIENNAVERCFRSIAKGRENWLQCGSHNAARHTAFMYSLAESCRINGLDFGLYIETVLQRIQNGDMDYRSMLPNIITLPEETANISAA